VPYVIGRPPRRGVALIAACIGLLVSAVPAAASGPHHAIPPRGGFPAPPAAPSASTCHVGALSQPFSQFGDLAYYTPVQGGSFSGPLAGWNITNGSVVAGGDPWNVANAPAPDQRMLQLSGGGEAVSPSFCLSNAFPSWRFFLQSVGSSSASALSVWVQWTDASGNSGHVPVTALDGTDYSAWGPSPVLVAGKNLADGATVNAQLVFSARSGDAWNVDDVYVDPYAR
jgi:hypothetical protein